MRLAPLYTSRDGPQRVGRNSEAYSADLSAGRRNTLRYCALRAAAVSSPAAAPPDIQPDESGGTCGPGSGSAAALALDPGRAKTVMASLAGGFSNVKNSPFAGHVAANAAGGAIEGGGESCGRECCA